MSFYGGCNCGCGGRHSIDNVTGRPIYIEDYVIPVFKGSTLETEFQFPFTITDDYEFSVISDSAPDLEDATITQTSNNVITIRWEAETIDGYSVGSNNTFRVRAEDTLTNEVKVYNLITIRIF
jgi:hypothetical protein